MKAEAEQGGALNSEEPEKKYLLKTGKIHPPSAYVKCPLFFTALRAESSIAAVHYPWGPVPPHLLQYGEECRGYPYRWAKYNRRYVRKGYAGIKEWLDGTPAVKEWFYEPNSMVAPKSWPNEVLRSWGKLPVPHPYEVASMKRGTIPMSIWCHPSVQLLRTFSWGVSISYLSKMTGDPRPWVINALREGTEMLADDPRFQLWALNIDWETTAWPPQLDGGILERLKFRHKLITAPHYMTKPELLKLTDSPLFWKLVKQNVFKTRKNKLRKGLHWGRVGAPHFLGARNG